ncbi:MAG: FAD-dependent oxidoreductase [Pseudomonadota bacterium]
MTRIAIIGAGLCGLTAARALQNEGLSPVVFDKGRGVGGRLSTRRAENGLQFDHGAQYLSAKDPSFAAFLAEAEAEGAATPWQVSDEAKTVGVPGMSGIAKFLAQGIDIRQSVEIQSLQQDSAGWRIADEPFDRVISTVPAPQAIRLLSEAHPLRGAMSGVVMEPNLTLMLALPDTDPPFETRRDPHDDVAWLALDSAKHDRAGPACWVAQAGLAWSKAHLELDKDEIAQKLLPLVCERLGADPLDALYVSAHRWRYAQASTPLGEPFLTDSTLFVGGDWAISNRAEGAWLSGSAMARALLETL